VLDLLCRVAERHGMALLCTLHQPELAQRYFHRVIEIQDGIAAEEAGDAVLRTLPSAAG
jgi:phosphonate transport system ATP-binding protein